MVEQLLSSPLGEVRLRCWPHRRNERLQAWDGADRYLLEQVVAQQSARPWLVFNDSQGALAVSLSRAGQAALSCTDDWLAYAAVNANASDNGLAAPDWAWLDELPARLAQQAVGGVLFKVPRQVPLLEAQLAVLCQCLPPGMPVWLAGLDKHLPRHLREVLDTWLTQVQTLPGRFKAHGFSAVTGGAGPADADSRLAAVVDWPEQGWQLHNRAGVFAWQQVDIGARLLLQALPDSGGDVADLGCGSGVLGMAMLAQHADARVWFCDSSRQAILSAGDNVARCLPAAGSRVQFHQGNGLDELQQRFDHILLNPPFHRGAAVDTAVGKMLIRHAARHLRPDGSLRLVVNRHLDYRGALSRAFARREIIASNDKFVVWCCRP
ncbi:MAG: methyltransferase [Alcanivoracaceae bacterium]|nr:methyltransferase [Alcanivoracaceae bacterium]